LSPDGTGLRILLLGNLPAYGRRKGDYENFQTGRFLPVSGWHVSDTPTTVEPRQEALLRVHGWFFAERGRRRNTMILGLRAGSTGAALLAPAPAVVPLPAPPLPEEDTAALDPNRCPWGNVRLAPLPISVIAAALQRRLGAWPRRVGARLFAPGPDCCPRWLDD